VQNIVTSSVSPSTGKSLVQETLNTVVSTDLKTSVVHPKNLNLPLCFHFFSRNIVRPYGLERNLVSPHETEITDVNENGTFGCSETVVVAAAN
jgi:hypothetical protein